MNLREAIILITALSAVAIACSIFLWNEAVHLRSDRREQEACASMYLGVIIVCAALIICTINAIE